MWLRPFFKDPKPSALYIENPKNTRPFTKTCKYGRLLLLMDIKSRILCGIVTISNAVYLIWLPWHVVGIGGWILFVAEFMITSLTFLFIINHWEQKHEALKQAEVTGSLDVFLPVVNEPLWMFERTLREATKIKYSNKNIYILDDGQRLEVKAFAEKYNVHYLTRNGGKDGNKAGNLNFGMKHSSGEYILVLDADQYVTDHNIAQEGLHYFANDPKIAIVSTRQAFDVPENDFNHDALFFQHMQPGKNDDNASISCGSGVFYRRTAMDIIGGFATWNIVEDLTSTYLLHSKGFISIYLNKPYTMGTAPVDLSTIYKQRGVWSLDTMRLFFRKSPLFTPGLTLRQRFHYFEMGWCYVVSAVAIPALFLIPPVALLSDVNVIDDPLWYLILRIPSLFGIIYMYYRLSDRSITVGQFWASLCFLYLKSLILSWLPFKTKYKVTNKLRLYGVGKRDLILILPHLAFIIFGFYAVYWRMLHFDYQYTSFIGINLMWITVMLYWFIPIIRKGIKLE